VKRAAVLLVLVGLPLALSLFPGLRRAALRKLRLFLILWAGAILFVGVFSGAWSSRADTLTPAQAVLTAVGLLFVLFALAAVVRDAMR